MFKKQILTELRKKKINIKTKKRKWKTKWKELILTQLQIQQHQQVMSLCHQMITWAANQNKL